MKSQAQIISLYRCERKNSDWSLKIDLENRLDKFETVVESTNDKLVELTGMYDDIQDRIWEIEKVNKKSNFL